MSPPAYTLRPATPADEPFLYALFRATMRASINQLWGDWDEARWSRFFRDQFQAARYQVVQVGGADVGALVVDVRSDEVYLDTVEIAPGYQGRGLGTAIVRAVLEDAAERGLPVRLQVNRANRARALYERLGFREVGRSDTHVCMRTALHRTEDRVLD